MIWWPSIGATSLMVGLAFGLFWAAFSTSRRRRKYIKAAIPPVGQLRWFAVNLCAMSCYIALITALGLATAHDILPLGLFWYLLGMSALAFISALMLPATPAPRQVTAVSETKEPPATPPFPLRRSA